MSHRVIQGLKWAQPCPRPTSIPPTAVRKGAKAAGLAYEKRFATALPQARHGQWFEFEDVNGLGYCCPDFLLKHAGAIFVLELKLTDCPAGQTQLTQLYLPVVRACSSKQIVGVEVVKNLRRDSQVWRLIDSIPQALYVAYKEPPMFLWTGQKLTLD